jgi:phospholipase/carboxylesterase
VSEQQDQPPQADDPATPAWALPIEWWPEPIAAAAPQQLIVLLHGWQQDATAMLALAQALRATFPQAALLAPDAPQAASAVPGRRQWYAVEDLTPENWPQRVQAAVPGLLRWLHAQQSRLGVSPAATALAGFSQGAVLALQAALAQDGVAGRVLAFSGCFATPPTAAPQHSTVHFFHGSADPTIPVAGARNAMGRLAELQGDATIDIAEGIGHELHPALIERALFRLQNHIPLRTWRAALGAAPLAAPSSSAAR